jgi:hypothetical protein
MTIKKIYNISESKVKSLIDELNNDRTSLFTSVKNDIYEDVHSEQLIKAIDNIIWALIKYNKLLTKKNT